MTSKRYSSALLTLLPLVIAAGILPATAQVQVSSTNPAAAPQGTVNLNVIVNGNGFKRGATAQWFVSGTTNPGGITVNSTTVNGSSKLTANITVALDAITSGFDVVVTNTDGRTGKGTDAFTVTSKGTPVGCWTTGTPSGFSLATVLNPVQPSGAALIATGKLGNAISVRPLDLNRDGVVDTLAAFVASGAGSPPGTYVFFLDPATGQAQATNPVTGAAWLNPLLVLSGVRGGHAAAGDVNGDGVPDFAMSMAQDASAYLFVGNVSGSPNYTPSYTAYQLVPPPGAPTAWGEGVALGDLDGDGKDEVVVGAIPGKRDTAIPAVFIYDYTGNGVSFVRKIQDPTGTQSSSFGGELYGNGVAIGNIDGNPGNELVVGASGGTNGLVYVFPYPASQSNYFTLSGPGPGFGEGVGIADVNKDGTPDLVVITGHQFSGSDTTAQALVFAGNVHPGNSYTNQLLPATGLAYSWAAPNSGVGEMLAAGAVAVGNPNATNASGTSCTMKGGVGAVHLFTSPFASSQQPNYVFEPPTLVGSNAFEFGYGVGVVPGYPFLLIGAHFQDVGTTSNAGQVYVYKKN